MEIPQRFQPPYLQQLQQQQLLQAQSLQLQRYQQQCLVNHHYSRLMSQNLQRVRESSFRERTQSSPSPPGTYLSGHRLHPQASPSGVQTEVRPPEPPQPLNSLAPVSESESKGTDQKGSDLHRVIVVSRKVGQLARAATVASLAPAASSSRKPLPSLPLAEPRPLPATSSDLPSSPANPARDTTLRTPQPVSPDRNLESAPPEETQRVWYPPSNLGEPPFSRISALNPPTLEGTSFSDLDLDHGNLPPSSSSESSQEERRSLPVLRPLSCQPPTYNYLNSLMQLRAQVVGEAEGPGNPLNPYVNREACHPSEARTLPVNRYSLAEIWDPSTLYVPGYLRAPNSSLLQQLDKETGLARLALASEGRQ